MKTKKDKILAALAAGQDAATVAKKFGVSKSYVYVTRWKANKKKPAKKKAAVERAAKKEDNPLDWKWVTLPDETPEEKPDPVNSPPHYTAGGIETIEFIEAKDFNYRLGNVIKYVSRVGKKDSDPVQDLEKAAWYLKREIEARKGA